MIEQIRSKLEWMFSDLIFEEGKHLYFVNGTNYPSVSTLIKKHETPVNFKFLAKKIADKEGKTTEEVQESWDKIKEDACTLGTNTHSYAENYDGIKEPENELEISVKKFLDELPEYYEIVFKEIRMYSREYRYAGTADLLLLDKRTNTLVIADFKTNKDLYKSYNKLLAPFQKLEQNNFNKYQFQLSYYQIMIEQSGYDVSNRVIIWLKRDGTYEIISTKDYTKELRFWMLNKN